MINTGNAITNESMIVLARYSGIPILCVKLEMDFDMKSREEITAIALITNKIISITIQILKEQSLLKVYSLYFRDASFGHNTVLFKRCC
jgi:hypothetical protein